MKEQKVEEIKCESIERDAVTSILDEILSNPLEFHRFNNEEFDNLVEFLAKIEESNPDEFYGFVGQIIREYDKHSMIKKMAQLFLM